MTVLLFFSSCALFCRPDYKAVFGLPLYSFVLVCGIQLNKILTML